jgi:threonine aldolase
VCLLDGPRGLITAGEVERHINPDDVHRPVTSLVEVENSMNKGGGTLYKYDELVSISNVCRTHGLKFHLDGARLFNALVETGEKPDAYGRLFDSVSVCLSKGLGAPTGSLLMGNKQFIRQARRVRKAFGGGMRQAGYLAAAGIYALTNNIDRLKMDNERARYLGNVLSKLSFVEMVIPVETNIVIFRLREKDGANEFLAVLRDHNIHALQMDPQTVRFVSHLDFTDEMLQKTELVLNKI